MEDSSRTFDVYLYNMRRGSVKGMMYDQFLAEYTRYYGVTNEQALEAFVHMDAVRETNNLPASNCYFNLMGEWFIIPFSHTEDMQALIWGDHIHSVALTNWKPCWVSFSRNFSKGFGNQSDHMEGGNPCPTKPPFPFFIRLLHAN